MDIKQLRYFVAIVDASSVTRASQLLHIAQPALSYHLSNLEAHLNTKLLNRNTSGVTPTASGELLYKHAKSLLRQIENLEISVSQHNSSPSGKVTIGLPGSTSRLLAIPLLQKLRQYPGILLEIVERQSGALAEVVAQAQVDLAITVDASAPPGVTMTPLVNEELFAILPQKFKVQHKKLTLQDLSRLPLALPSKPNLTRVKLDLAFMEANLKYTLLAEASTTDLLVRIARSGEACTVLPWSSVSEEIESGQLFALQIKKPIFSRELSLCVSDSVPLSQPARIVQSLVLDEVAALLPRSKWLPCAS